MEIHFSDNHHPIVQGILGYLASGADYEEGRWKNTVSSNNDYPHAPWWHTDSSSSSRSEFNPTAIIAGFILKFADRGSKLYEQGMEIAQELTDLFLHNPNLEMHPLKCFVTMADLIEQANVQNLFAFSKMQEAANRQINQLITRDSQEWNGYSCRPSVFIKSPDTPVYEQNKVLLDQELAYLLTRRNEAGVWDITWGWGSYDKEFAVSENWWKAEVIINNLLLLRAFRRL
ncbi:hypothetical protein PaeBR_17940 [Paenibacillus sp. BR2-3]|uniref:hypothetical protein n=1 Tax=Paenibacillus sp. BR2-3 TaxID=3048494 RepID=UPI0039773A2C